MRHRVVVVALAGALSACSHRAAPIVALPMAPTPTERLAAADALVREGCLDCLLDAYREYQALRALPAAQDAAADGVVRSAGLIGLRERELGILDDDSYLAIARSVATESAARQEKYLPVLDVLDTVAMRGVARDPEIARRQAAALANRPQWLAMLREHASDDALWAAAWAWYSCGNNTNRNEREFAALVAPTLGLRDAPVVTYQAAVCTAGGDSKLSDLAAADPRFHEVDFWLGFRQMAGNQLDEAQASFTRANAWRPRWPSLVLGLADLYTTAEEFEAALDYYERAIALAPGESQSLLGRVRALSYLGRSEEAIVRATELLPVGTPGDAYFWRAWNENRLDRLDAAWTDVEAAERVWVNNQVLKLAGLVAYRRRELDVAKAKFQAAMKIDAEDCDTRFNLSGVHTELGEWTDSADGYASTVTCYDAERARLAAEAAALQRSGGSEARVSRQVARREQDRAGDLRRIVQSWFNAAVANLQLNRKDEARQLAEKIEDDEQFGARAKEILARVR